jgi:ABC-2 type transport system permease protein
MKMMTILLNDLKRLTRNPISLILLLAMPVMMIALMGYALKPVFNIETKGIEKFQVLYINKDQGIVGQSFDVFIKGPGNQFLEIVPSEASDAMAALTKEKLPVALSLPADLSEKIRNGEKAGIEIVSTGKDSIKDNVVRSLVEAFINQTNLQAGIMKGAQSLTSSAQAVPDLAQIETQVISRYGKDFVQTRNITEPALSNSIHPALRLTSFQFFAVSMLIFFLLTIGMGLGMNIISDRTDRIFLRIGSYPVTQNQYLMGKTLGNSVTGILQALFIIVFTTYAFRINWGTEYLGLGIVILAVLFTSSGIAVIASSILNSEKALSAGLTVFFWMLTFVSGGFTAIPIFEPLAKFTVNRWAFESITALMMGQGLANITGYLIPLVGLSLVFWMIGVSLYQRRAFHE